MKIADAWFAPEAWLPVRGRRIFVGGDGPLVDTLIAELRAAGGVVHRDPDEPADLAFTLGGDPALGDEGFDLSGPTVRAHAPHGLLHGLFHLLRGGADGAHRPAVARRMLDHWDNVDVHPAMGQVERGYAGGSLFWAAGVARRDLDRVRAYARLLAAAGINAVCLNNVNVHATEATLLTGRLGEVAELAGVFRAYGIRVHLSVSFAAPVRAGLASADPLDDDVRAWWERTTAAVYATIPDFGGYLVKADSEGQPGPFSYGRSHADGANMLAAALKPHGGVVHWRAFVYNHRQDWRDRTVDRARAAFDHFTPLDGQFADNVVLQVKHGPLDFQAREPVSPLIGAMPATRLAVEFQVTQEYTGQQRHVCYLAPMWSELLRGAAGPAIAGFAAELVAVANVGDDRFWTGHPLAQANVYAFGRLAWDPALDPSAILDEWADLTFPGAAVKAVLHAIMDDSWRTYERYTAPLGVGFMVRPGHHYGPDVDGYEYTPWGTYHFADRDGVGVDRTRATGHRLHRPVPAAVGRHVRVAGDLPRRAGAVLPPPALRACAAVGQHRDPAHLRHPLRRRRAGRRHAPPLAGRGRRGARRRVRPGRRPARRAGAQRRRMARPGQHVLLPQVRGAGRKGPPDLLTAWPYAS